MFVPYCTRKRVARAAEIRTPAWLAAEIDAAIEQGSRAVDKLCRRGDDIRPAFAPWAGTIEYDWPSVTEAGTYRYWLGAHSLLSTSAVTSGGDDITADVIGHPPQYGPPYEALDVDQSTSSVFTTSEGIGQRSLSITGEWSAAPIDELTRPSWALDEDIDASATTAEIAASLSVGSLVRIGSERMIVTDQDWTATADTVTLAAASTAQTLAVTSGAAYSRGDELLVDAERMEVRDIAGNSLIVQRATDGTTLAAHSTATVYVLRNCTVTRGALGTTAAAHSEGDPVHIYRFPAVVEQLAVAYALDQRVQEGVSYSTATLAARIADLEARVLGAYGRVLSGAV